MPKSKSHDKPANPGSPLKVIVRATDDYIRIKVANGTSYPKVDRFNFSDPGIITGADLAKLLEVCGIQVSYSYRGRGRRAR